MVREFLATSHCAVRAACFDVAGPVIDGRAHLTNLPWTVDAAALRAELALDEVFLLNDLQATAYAAPRLRAEELHTINIGKRDATGPIAVIAPGTGLGEAFLVWSNGCYLACSSEGGHASFAPTDRRQAALWHYLSCKFGHVSVERVCSGLGIANIYDFLRDADPASETVPFAAQLARRARGRLGWRACYIGRFGDDEPGRVGRRSLEDEGVDIGWAGVVPGGRTRTAVILVDHHTGTRTVLWDRDVRIALRGEDVPGDAIRASRVLLVDCDDVDAAIEAARVARAAGVVTVIDVEAVLPGLDALLPLIDVVIASEGFPETLTRVSDEAGALTAMADRSGPGAWSASRSARAAAWRSAAASWCGRRRST